VAARKRILIGLAALACVITFLTIWRQADRVSSFCQSVERGSDADPVVVAARHADFETWSLPQTTWQGVQQHPIIVVQDGGFLCGIQTRFGRVLSSKKWLERDFRTRYPRRITQAGRD
jgi:hypothetical protein